jgi:hypothetical protein
MLRPAIMCVLLLLSGRVALAADESGKQGAPGPAGQPAVQPQQDVRVTANRRALRQRLQDLRSAASLSEYELIRRYWARDDALLLALLNREFRAASKLLLSLPTADLERLLTGGTVERKAEELDARQLYLARLAVGVEDPAGWDVGVVSFSGVDTGSIVFRWLPDADSLAKEGPPSPNRLFVVIPAGRDLAPQYRGILRDELRRTPYQGLLPKR